MYTGPNMAQPAGNTVAKTTLPVIAAICCGATLLLLLASTIVLALIPIYIPQKTLTKASTTSNEVSTYIPLADSTRKRQTDSISSAVGGTVDDTDTLSSLKTRLLVILVKSKRVKDISTLVCDIVQLASGRRRRLAISKRQSSSGQTSLRCRYFIIFLDSLTTASQQNTAGDLIRNLFQSDSSIFSLFVFDNLLITINGQRRGFRCRANGFGIMSVIRSGGAGLLDSQATVATTATTVSVTAGPSG